MVGLGFLAMTGAIMLITNVLFGSAVTTAITSGAAMSMFVTLWYLLPLQQRIRAQESESSPSSHPRSHL